MKIVRNLSDTYMQSTWSLRKRGPEYRCEWNAFSVSPKTKWIDWASFINVDDDDDCWFSRNKLKLWFISTQFKMKYSILEIENLRFFQNWNALMKMQLLIKERGPMPCVLYRTIHWGKERLRVSMDSLKKLPETNIWSIC